MTWTYFLFSYIFVPVLILAYGLLGIWLIFRVASKPKLWLGKVAAALSITLLVIAVPTGDVIVGRVKFSDLCEREASVRVLRTVALDAKYLSKDGSPKTELVVGTPGLRIAERYVMDASSEQVLAWPRIEKSVVEIRDIERGDALGQIVDFRYWGGWLVQYLPGHRSAERCPELKGRMSLERMVFRTNG